MDEASVIAQMRIFNQNLCEISDLVKRLSSIPDQPDTINSLQQIVPMKMDLLNTIVMLNKMLISKLHYIYPGSLILAPRLYRGSICWDFAVVTSIEQNCNPGDSGFLSSSAAPVNIPSINLNEPVNEHGGESTIYCLWLHPQTEYEFLSTRVSFVANQIKDTKSALHMWQEHEQALQQVSKNSEVLYISKNWGNANNRFTAGRWIGARVVSVSSESTSVVLAPTITDKNHNHLQTVTVVHQLTEVCCVPRPAAVSKTFARSASHRRETAGANAEGSGDEESDEDSVHDGITQLPSYLQQQRIKYASSGSLSGLTPHKVSGEQQGDWEVHTKGFGSKILAKMGFKKNSGGGLGKHLQGIAAPVEGLVKALPAGLSLDYIGEVCKKSPFASGADLSLLTPEEALAAKEKEIKLGIVARFNAAHQPGTAKSKAKVHKSSTRPIQKAAPAENSDMFGFLNKLESKQQHQQQHGQGASTSTSAGRNPAQAFGAAAAVAGSSRSGIIDVKKPPSNAKNVSASKIF